MADTVKPPGTGTAWVNTQPTHVRDVLTALGRMLTGEGVSARTDWATFISEEVKVDSIFDLQLEETRLRGPVRICAGLAAMELAEEFPHTLGPGGTEPGPPAFDVVDLRPGETVEIPGKATMVFPAGTVNTEHPVAVRFAGSDDYYDGVAVKVYTPGSRGDARAVIEHLKTHGAALNPFKGRSLRASTDDNGLALTIQDPPTETFADIVVPSQVIDEVLLNVDAVAVEHARLDSLGLGGHRGVMLVGPPGVGKTMITRAVVNRLAGEFTCIEVDAKTGPHCLTQVMEEARTLQPAVVVLNDVDLWANTRRTREQSNGVAMLLDSIDMASADRVLTLATSNDPQGLQDAAAVRNGRFDSLVVVDYPTRADAAELVRRIFGDHGSMVDPQKVAAALPEKTSGADIREIARRAVLLSSGDAITTDVVVSVVRSGSWRPDVDNVGQYL